MENAEWKIVADYSVDQSVGHSVVGIDTHPDLE